MDLKEYIWKNKIGEAFYLTKSDLYRLLNEAIEQCKATNDSKPLDELIRDMERQLKSKSDYETPYVITIRKSRIERWLKGLRDLYGERRKNAY